MPSHQYTLDDIQDSSNSPVNIGSDNTTFRMYSDDLVNALGKKC